MAQPNPFMPQQPQAPAPAQPQQPNPYAQPQQPQGNPYAQPQQAPQNYAPSAQPQYAPTPQGWPQGAAPAAATGGNLVARPGSFVRPSAPVIGTGGSFPKVSDLNGRLLLILPERLEQGVQGKFGVQDKLTATLIVLDGGPLSYNGNTHNTPHVVKGMWFQQGPVVKQLMEALQMRLAGQAGLALGRLWKTGPGNSDPWVLADPQPQDVQVYDAYVTQVNPFSL